MNWPRQRRLLRHENIQREQRDPLHEVGQVPYPATSGYIQSPVNIPDAHDVPLREHDQNPDTHLPPILIPEIVQALSRDLLGQLRANVAAGSRVFPRDNQPTVTVANQDIQIMFPMPIRHVMFQNNSGGVVDINFDEPASPGKLAVPALGFFATDVICRAVHIYATSVLNINGDVAGHLFLAGFM